MDNPLNLQGKTAVVTGGAGILGTVFCEALVNANAHVAIVDLNRKRAAALAERLGRHHEGEVIGIPCDVASPRSVKAMVHEVKKRFGGIDILLNNAALIPKNLKPFFAAFEDYSLDEWRKVMSVNIDGVFLVAQAVGKEMMRQRQGGSIIQTASIYGILSPDHRIYSGSRYRNSEINSPAVYAASKAAVIGLTRYLATYWATKNIRVNALVPGGVESGQNVKFVKRYSERVPLGRMAQPNDIVGAMLYLASNASRYVTGQALVVDGGLSAW